MIKQEQDGYELFRRAITHRDEHAWAVIYTLYRPLLIAWAQRFGAQVTIGESCEDLADEAFTRAWQALAPAGFRQFPNLASLLAYLRRCVSTVVIDHARAQAARER